MNIILRKDFNILPNERGYSVFTDDGYQIVVPDCPVPQKDTLLCMKSDIL